MPRIDLTLPNFDLARLEYDETSFSIYDEEGMTSGNEIECACLSWSALDPLIEALIALREKRPKERA